MASKGLEEENVTPKDRRIKTMSRIQEEEDWVYDEFLDSLDGLILTEEEIAALPEEERRRYSIRSSIRKSIQQLREEEIVALPEEERRRYCIRGSIDESKASRQKNNLNAIEEEPDDYKDNINSAMSRKDSIANSRKQSLDSYASLRASRDKVLSEEYIRGIPEDTEPMVFPQNTLKRNNFLMMIHRSINT
jgi:hypothetical protein